MTEARHADAAEMDKIRVQHRVKNIMASIRSLAHRTAEFYDDIDEFMAHFVGRLDALSRIQNVISRTPDGVEMEELVRDELVAHDARGSEGTFVEGPRVLLQSKAAEALGLAFHELAVNAVKFGALSCPGARLEVRWSVEEDAAGRTLILVWRESRVAPLAPPQAGRGLGRQIVEHALGYELGAGVSMSFAEDGLVCRIAIPWNDQLIRAGARA